MFTAIQRLGSLIVADVMATKIIEISAHVTMAEAAEELLRHGLSSAPVVDERGVCVGMLSAADFLKRDRIPSDASLGSSSHQPHLGDCLQPFAIIPHTDTVKSYMSEAVQSIASRATLLDAARVMCAAHLHHLPVLDGHRVVGIISSLDVTAAIVNAFDEANTR